MLTTLAFGVVLAFLPPLTEQSAKVKFSAQFQVRYLLTLPDGYENSKEKFPLLIFLHGAGERGYDMEKVKVHGPPRYIKEGKNYPFIVVAPQCPEGETWNVQALSAMLTQIEKKLRVDRDRIYLTGLSMGGYGTWEWIGMEPKRFAAVIPICGGGSRMWTLNTGGLPIWCVHGDADESVPISESRSMIERAQRAGAKIRFTIYEGVGHGVWNPFYEDQPWVEWLLKHCASDRKQPSPGEYVEEHVKKSL